MVNKFEIVGGFMQQTANEVIKTIRALPLQEKAKVYQWLEEERGESAQTIQTRENAKEQFERFRKRKNGFVKTARNIRMNGFVWLATNSSRTAVTL